MLGLVVELRALETGRWTYEPAMPLVPELDVAVVPLVQLLILSPVAFRVSTRLVRKRPAAAASDTATTRRRYDRIAPLYDALELGMELRFRSWRRDLWSRAMGDRILEVGVGTGKNLNLHPPHRQVVAIDISERMLARARRKAKRLGSRTLLAIADAEALPFAHGSFDTVVASFVFCSVPDPIQGLKEARRVLEPGGRLLLLEHVLSNRPLLRKLMRRLDSIAARISGAHIDRETVENVGAAGFDEVADVDLSLDIVKSITARAPDG